MAIEKSDDDELMKKLKDWLFEKTHENDYV